MNARRSQPPDLLRYADEWLTRFPPDASQLIGVSGGRDSIALLHALATRGYRRLLVCHLDHALRPESANDAHFVSECATRLGQESVIERVDVRTLAVGRHESIETAGRHARAAFFSRIANDRGIAAAFLAHHADDQVETFLFNLCRGAGSTGLAAMRPLTRFTAPVGGLWMVRPLLAVWREEIDAYVAFHHLDFREDGSNADPSFTRNRVRHEALPALSIALGRDVRRAIWRAAEILRDEDEFLTALPETHAPAGDLRTAALREQPAAIQRRLLHRWLLAAGVRAVGFEEVEAVRALLTSRHAKVNLPGDLHVRRKAGRLFVVRPEPRGLSD